LDKKMMKFKQIKLSLSLVVSFFLVIAPVNQVSVTSFPVAQNSEAPPEFQDKLQGQQLVDALKKGGYIIYFRHAQTEKDYADQIEAKMGDCSTQRMLSEAGWKQAREIGIAFEKMGIPVGKVYSSEYCRAWQTADLAFGQYQKNIGLNFAPAEEYTEAQIKQMREGVMPLLTDIPPKGTNTIIVGHDDVFEAATGIYPEE
jgi:phosphohistidine phosphatase SixA